MRSGTREGGCHCGAVRYRVQGPALDHYHCHCSQCRKHHGALFGTFSAWKETALALERGAEAVREFATTARSRRSFCRACGTPLFGADRRFPGLVMVSTATLDDSSSLDNRGKLRHIFVGSKVSWLDIGDGLPCHDEWD